MSRMHNQYRELESSYNYIDKTECLEKEIERFPSVYIEGAAGCGKTTMMRMLLEKHPEVDYTVLWMDEDEKYEEYERYVDKYVDNSRWLILENVPEELPLHTVGMIKRSIRRLGGQDRIILIGRNEIPDALLGTFWNREMGLVTQNSMLFDQDEVECLIKQYGSRTSPEQLLRYTGGWAGIVDVILRLESKYGAWNPESCWHEMNRYIKGMILDTLQREEREILHLAQYLPWVDEEMCEEILGTAHAEVILGRMLRKGFLVHTEGEPDTRWSVAPIFCHIGEASEDAAGGAVILDSTNNAYTDGNVQDLLDKGPKNELYLYPNQTLTFKLNAEAQIGLKALDQTVTYVINDETKKLTSSTDMFYQANAGTVTIQNTGTGILSITKVKATDPTNAEKLFAMLTADDFMPALLSLGYETEKPMADATANLNLVDYTGKTIASTSLTANGEQGTDATFTADQIKSAVTSALPEGYAVVDVSKIADQTVKYGESADVNVQIGKVATLKVTYKKLFGKTVGTATLTGVQTSAGSKYSFSASEIKKAVPSGYWTIKLWGTKVKYGTTGTLTVNVF